MTIHRRRSKAQMLRRRQAGAACCQDSGIIAVKVGKLAGWNSVGHRTLHRQALLVRRFTHIGRYKEYGFSGLSICLIHGKRTQVQNLNR